MANTDDTTRQRIHEAAHAGPEACVKLLLELCPGLDFDAVARFLPIMHQPDAVAIVRQAEAAAADLSAFEAAAAPAWEWWSEDSI